MLLQMQRLDANFGCIWSPNSRQRERRRSHTEFIAMRSLMLVRSAVDSSYTSPSTGSHAGDWRGEIESRPHAGGEQNSCGRGMPRIVINSTEAIMHQST